MERAFAAVHAIVPDATVPEIAAALDWAAQQAERHADELERYCQWRRAVN